MEAVDDLPPPYNIPDAFVTDVSFISFLIDSFWSRGTIITVDIGLSKVEESRQNFIVGRSDEVQLNQATPIYRYYNGIRDEIREDDDTLSIDNPIPHDNAPVHLDGPLTDGSTETIPSSWEPTWADHMDESGGRLSLFQTQSMNDLTEISPLHHGEYRNRHIYLSEFRGTSIHWNRTKRIGIKNSFFLQRISSLMLKIKITQVNQWIPSNPFNPAMGPARIVNQNRLFLSPSLIVKMIAPLKMSLAC